MNKITDYVHKSGKILWQQNEDFSEQPILIECFHGCVNLTQGENIITIQYTAIKDLIKILKDAKEPD